MIIFMLEFGFPLVSRLTALSIFISLLIPAIAIADESEFAYVKYVEGTARKKTIGSEGWMAVDSASTIAAGDSVKTLENSKAILLLPGSGIVRIGPSSIVSFGSAHSTIPELVIGDLWLIYDHDQNYQEICAELPFSGVYANRAEVRFSTGNDCTTEIKVYDCEITLVERQWNGNDEALLQNESHERPCEPGQADADSAFNVEFILASGQKAIQSSIGQLIYRGPFSSDDPDEQSEWVRWNKDRDSKQR